MVWLPLVSLGLFAVWFRGRGQLRNGLPPTAWAIGLQAIIALVVVTAFIPSGLGPLLSLDPTRLRAAGQRGPDHGDRPTLAHQI